jgi:hypothetical protein
MLLKQEKCDDTNEEERAHQPSATSIMVDELELLGTGWSPRIYHRGIKQIDSVALVEPPLGIVSFENPLCVQSLL